MRSLEVVQSGVGPSAYELWREEALTPKLFDVEVDLDTFKNTFDRWWLGDIPLISFDQGGAVYSRSSARARADGADALWVQTVETGAIHAWSPDRTVHVTANMSAVCDLGRPVRQQTFAGSGRLVVLPRAAFGGADLDDIHGAAASGSRHAILSDHLRWLSEAPAPASAAAVEDRVASSLAAVVLACVGAPAKVPEAAVGALTRATSRRAAACIDRRLGDGGLNAAEVAREIGVSRATLYRACSEAGGVDALIWERRLQAVRAALSDPREVGRLKDVAARFGFGNASHFSSRFKERFGFSPSNLRPF